MFMIITFCFIWLGGEVMQHVYPYPLVIYDSYGSHGTIRLDHLPSQTNNPLSSQTVELSEGIYPIEYVCVKSI